MKSRRRFAAVLITILLLQMAMLPLLVKADVNTLAGNQKFPSAAIGPDGVIYVVYQDDRNGDYDIFLARSFDGGATFDDPSNHILIYDDGTTTAFQGQPDIYVDSSGTIHVTFVAGMAYILYYTHSTIDDISNFSIPLKISDTPAGTENVAQYPSICVDDVSNHIYVGWRDMRTLVPKACYAVGTIIGTETVFSENRWIYGDPTGPVRQSRPSMTVDNSGTLFAAWHDDHDGGDINVYYAISRDFGESFEYQGRVDDALSYPDTNQISPSIASDSMGRVYVVYADDRDGPGYEVVVFAVRDFDGSFSSHQIISPSKGSCAPEISILDSGLIFVMYSEVIEVGHETYRGMFYLSSLDNGNSWSSRDQVDPHTVGINNYYPCISPQDDGQILLIWESNNEADMNIVSTLKSKAFPPRLEASISPTSIRGLIDDIIGFDLLVTANSQPMDSCNVQFLSDRGGQFSDVVGLDNGYYHADYTIPSVPIETKISICVKVTEQGYPETGAQSHIIVSENLGPVAVIAGPVDGDVDQTLDFDGSGSYDPDGTIVSYVWDFDDGSFASGPLLSHSWSTEGTYEVNLTVTDNRGSINSTIKVVTIIDPLPVLAITISMDSWYLEVGGTAQVVVTVYSEGNPIEGAFIDTSLKGEKEEKPVTAVPDQTYTDSNGKAYINLVCEIINHSYPEILYVYSSKNGYEDGNGSLSFPVLLSPIAEFTYSIDDLNVDFDASSSYDPNGVIVSHSWDFGDGSSGSGMVTSHSYNDYGSYDVTLTVTDEEGATDILSQNVNVHSYLDVLIIPSVDPLVHLEWAEIAVQVTSAGMPVEGAEVVLTSSYPATIQPATATTNADGIALFDFRSRSQNGDVMITLMASATKDGYTEGTTSLDILLNYPDLYLSYELENDTVPSGGSVGVLLHVEDHLGQPVSGVQAVMFPGKGRTDPTGGETDIEGNLSFDYIAPILTDGEDEEVTIFCDVQKYGYEITSINITILVEFLPILETNAFADALYFWYEDIVIDVSVTFNGNPEGNIPVEARVLGGKGQILESPLYTDENGNVQFTYTTVIILTQDFVFIEFKAEKPGYIEGVDYLSIVNVIDFWVKASLVDLRIISCPESVEPGESLDVTVFAVDAKSNPISSLGLFFHFTTNISDDTVFQRTDVNGEASPRYNIPMTDELLELNMTIFYSQKGYIDTSNWTTIWIVPGSGTNQAPIGVASATPSQAYAQEIITFDGSASYDPDGTIVSWGWDFGDGTTGSGEIVTYAYADKGIFTAVLTVTDDQGATNTTTVEITIMNTPPVAYGTATPNPALKGKVITFDGSLSYDIDGLIIAWDWDFKDDTTASGEIVTHSYSRQGNYNVLLTVTDDSGSTDTVSIPVLVRK